jgi:tRNA threonylcarbamoyladenosine biosynthesis protein TsaB
MPMIEHALNISGLPMNDIDALAVCNGPGSFTGVRIGVSAVKGLAFAEQKPCIEVSTLASMAEGFRGLPMDSIVCCAMDARCQQVYSALFSVDVNGKLTRISNDEAISLDELKLRLAPLNKPIILVGDGAEACYAAFGDDLPNVTLAPITARYQSAANVAVAAMYRYHDGEVLSDVPSCTYGYYQSDIKPKPAPAKKKGWVCSVCGHVHEGEELPEGYVCPLCKHGREDFRPIG